MHRQVERLGSVRLMRTFAIPALLLLLVGCRSSSPDPSPIQPTLPLGSALAKAEAYTDAARQNVGAAQPHADPTGKAHLSSADHQLAAALEQLAAANAALEDTREQLLRQAEQLREERERYQDLYRGWACWIGRWILRVFWIIVGLLLLHFVGGFVALLVPGPIGAMLAWVSHLANPLGWFAAGREKIWSKIGGS